MLCVVSLVCCVACVGVVVDADVSGGIRRACSLSDLSNTPGKLRPVQSLHGSGTSVILTYKFPVTWSSKLYFLVGIHLKVNSVKKMCKTQIMICKLRNIP